MSEQLMRLLKRQRSFLQKIRRVNAYEHILPKGDRQ